MINVENEHGRKQILLEFERLMLQDAEFAGLAREFARKYRLDIDFGLHIPG